MWFWRRRRLPPPVLLPSLDRLAELVERVVALLDDLALAPEPPREQLVVHDHEVEPAADGWVAFVQAPDGYRLQQLEGPPPARGATVELVGEMLVVLRLGPSPLPGDRRRCAFCAMKERPAAERTFDR